MITMSALSTQYVQIPVAVTVSGTPYDPRADSVMFAFKLPGTGNPGGADWHPGSWDIAFPGSYLAQCLVGPANGGVEMPQTGTYTIWVKITDNPEVPVVTAGLLEIV